MSRSTRNECACGFRFDTETAKHRRKCVDCGRARVPKYVPKHKQALKESRDVDQEANDGYAGCWVCRYLGEHRAGAIQRDHVHVGNGVPRGLLCIYHNRKLGSVYTPELLEALLAYVSRGERSAVDELAA